MTLGVVAYRCPRCQAALEAGPRELSTWLRCPKCGRASLPPDRLTTSQAEPIEPDKDILVVPPDKEFPHLEPGDPDPFQAAPVNVRRIALALGILGALTMLMMAFIDGNMRNVATFAIIALALFASLGYSAWSRE